MCAVKSLTIYGYVLMTFACYLLLLPSNRRGLATATAAFLRLRFLFCFQKHLFPSLQSLSTLLISISVALSLISLTTVVILFILSQTEYVCAGAAILLYLPYREIKITLNDFLYENFYLPPNEINSLHGIFLTTLLSNNFFCRSLMKF